MSALPELIQAVEAAQGDPHRRRSALGRLQLALTEQLPSDPLLAASCLAVVEDADLRLELAPIAERATSRTATARALVVDAEGQGRVVEVVVALSPGGEGAWSPQAIARDAAIAAQLAVAVVTGGERWGVRWQVRGEGLDAFELRGSSIGLAIAVATRAALLQREVPAGWAFTGGVDLDGSVAAVAGIPGKLRAAAEAGLTSAAIPAAARRVSRPPRGLSVVPVVRLEALLEHLFPAPDARRLRLPWRPLVVLLPALLAWVSATDALDGLLQAALMRAVLAPLPAENTAILPLPPDADFRALRAAYPEVLAGLAAAGATAAAFDVLMLTETPNDTALAAAMGRLPVVLPVRWRGSGFQSPPAPLADATLPAIIEVEQDRLFSRVRRAPVRLISPDGTAHWHLAARALQAHLGAEPPTLADDILRIGVTRNPTRMERLYLPPVAPSPRLSWTDPTSWSAAKGRVVLLGVLEGRQDRLRTPMGDRYGVELHAALIEAMARQAALRVASPGGDALAALLCGGLTFAMAASLPRRRRLIAVVVPVAGLVVLAALLVAGLMLAPTPLLLAAIAALWAPR